jgi:DtxR family Mn-dependent transcriptional regulator
MKATKVMNEAVEEYLEAIYALEEDGKTAKTTGIAAILNVAPASVTEMLRKLQSGGYIKYEPYRGVEFTREGYTLAKKMKRKHRLLEYFLANTLKIDKDKVHDQACKMEHALSDEAEESLCKVLNHPDRCPDDNKIIPPCDKDVTSCVECMSERSENMSTVSQSNGKKELKPLKPLIQVKEGQNVTIAFVRGGRNVMQRLADMGLTPKTKVKITCAAPFGGPIKLSVRGSELCVGRGIAEKIFVEAD